MDLSFANDIPIWAKLLVLLIAIIFIGYSLKSLKSGLIRGPWFLVGVRFKRKEEPIAYWIFLSLWLGMGLAMLIFAIILFLAFWLV